MITKVLIMCLLIILSYQDLKRRLIDVRWLLVSGPVLIGLNIYYKEFFQGERLLIIGLGLACLGISFISKEAIGLGDSYTLIWAGLVMSFSNYFTSLLLASLLSFVLGALLFITKKASKIAFVPLIAIGYMASLLGGL